MLRLWDREFEHIRRLDVCRLFPNADELRQVVELSKAGLGAESRALRLQLHGCDLLTEVCRPGVEMPVAVLLQCVKLKVTHHGIQLHHTI